MFVLITTLLLLISDTSDNHLDIVIYMKLNIGLKKKCFITLDTVYTTIPFSGPMQTFENEFQSASF